MGLTMEQALLVPFNMLLDLIAIQQIKVEGATRKRSEQDELEEMLRMLECE